MKLYGKRFSIEENFRDSKDIHFGMGLSATHIGDTARRDRLLLLSALAVALLTLLGAAGESLGYDRWIKVNTAKKRTHSLFRQGQEYDLRRLRLRDRAVSMRRCGRAPFLRPAMALL